MRSPRFLGVLKVLVFATVLGGLVLGAGPRAESAHAQFTPTNGKIAFAVTDAFTVSSPIYTINPDGSGQTQLTSEYDFRPVWSPDGTKIAFHSLRDEPAPLSCDQFCNYEVYVMNADGSGLTRLTNHFAADITPVWSPDGTKIAFLSNRLGLQDDIYVMNADGSGQTQLTSSSAPDTSAVWSPDSSKIAFESERDANDEIYVMNADGSGQTNLTNDSADDYAPAWSPDGMKIAFYRELAEGNTDVLAMSADGSAETNLTNHPAPDYAPAWSPDGTKIAFERVSAEGNADVYVMNADGSGQLNLTNSPTYDFEPTWSPDGTKIAFSVIADYGHRYQFAIHTRNTDGSGDAVLLSPRATGCCNVDWQSLPPVGGLAELPRLDGGQAEVARTPSKAGGSSGLGVAVLAGVAAAGAVAMGGAGWYAGCQIRRRRLTR